MIINDKTRYLLIGGGGMLGKEIMKVFHDRDIVGFTHRELDICDEGAVMKKMLEHTPDVVINASGFTNVDLAEIETEKANDINGYGVGKLAKYCRDFGATLVHFSTDYVFDGAEYGGYKEESLPNPINAYGESKLLGEQLITEYMEAEYDSDDIGDEPGKYYVIRFSYSFGKYGENIIDKLKNKLIAGERLKTIDDQHFKLTFTGDLAMQLRWLLESNEYDSGTYHITNDLSANWYKVALEICHILNLNEDLVEPVKMAEWEFKAARPQSSVLLNTKLPQLRSYKEALADYLLKS